MSKRWGAVVRGHDFDLQDWREMLKLPFDPWIEVHGPDVVLRPSPFEFSGPASVDCLEADGLE
jgi:hypothetical protein